MKHIIKKKLVVNTAALLFVFVFAVIGATQLFPSKAATPGNNGDLNNDSKIDIFDLSILLAHYNTSDASADVNNDGTVNILDLSILLSNYGKQTGNPTSPIQFSPGLVSGSAQEFSLTGMVNVGGVRYARLEWDIGASTASMQSAIAAYANKGISVLPLAGFGGTMPTDAEANNLGNWAKVYGPGGTFWANRSDGHLAVKFIEFGNETNMGYQYNDDWSKQSYKDRARNYGVKFKMAHMSIQANNSQVGLLAQGDDGGSGSSNWIDGLYLGAPDLTSANRVAGWTIHPYGPFDCANPSNCFNYANPRILRMLQQIAPHGAPNTIPIDITEYGIASKNGVALTNNYGWPVNLTYAQAGENLTNTVNSLTGSPTYGSRIRLFMLFNVANNDYANPATDNDREHYFGAVDKDFNDKGAYTTAVRAIMRR